MTPIFLDNVTFSYAKSQYKFSANVSGARKLLWSWGDGSSLSGNYSGFTIKAPLKTYVVDGLETTRFFTVTCNAYNTVVTDGNTFTFPSSSVFVQFQTPTLTITPLHTAFTEQVNVKTLSTAVVPSVAPPRFANLKRPFRRFISRKPTKSMQSNLNNQAVGVITCTAVLNPLVVTFKSESDNNPISWKWTFQKVNSAITLTSTVQNPVITFKVAGDYTVTLLVVNAGGVKKVVGTITV